VKVLLEHRASIAAVDVDKNTPAALLLLADKVHTETLDLLRAAGCTEKLQGSTEEKRQKDILAGTARLHALMHVPEHLATPYLVPAVFSISECVSLLQSLEGAGWNKDRHQAHVTRDLPACEIACCKSDGWAFRRVMEALRGVADRHAYDPDGFAFRDLFFIRYDASPGGQAGLGPHKDGSVMSFNVLLSEPSDFEGGGTQFYPDEDRPDPPQVPTSAQGDMLIHAGRMLHGAAAVTSGVRIVLVGFVDVVSL